MEVSVAGYPGILRKELGIAPDLFIICGLAIGYADDTFNANLLHVGRDPIENNIVFLEELIEWRAACIFAHMAKRKDMITHKTLELL